MPDVSTEVAIATTTLGSAASSITFSSISGSYTDLKVIVLPKGGGVANTYVYLQFNGDTATNYSWTYLRGNGSAASSGRSTGDNGIQCCNISANPLPTAYPALSEIDIFSYAGSTYKTALCKGSIDQNGSGETTAIVGLWRNTAAITSVIIKGINDNLGAGTTATLYGIL